MLDPKKCGNILRKHFAEVTSEQFVENLKKYCPEVFEDDITNSEQEPLLEQDKLESKTARA